MILLGALTLSACDTTEFGPAEPDYEYGNKGEKYRPGESGFNLLNMFGGGGGNDSRQTGAGIGVNSYLWRATLDTISFMPLNSADPFGGVIITDWFAPQETPDERFKVNVFILGRELRADGIRVALFRQAKNASGQWSDARVSAEAATNIENQILTRARQLRLAVGS